MSRRTVMIVAGVLVVAGAAGAVGAFGQRMGRMPHADMMDDMGFGPGDGMMGPGGRRGGHAMGHGMGHGMGWRGGEGGPGRFWQRGMSQEDFDTRTRERFARLDKNSDGVIDGGEVEAAMASGPGRGQMQERMLQRMTAMFDTSRDGKITRDEFLVQVRKVFQRNDLNDDGKISDDDLPPMMRGQEVLKSGTGMAHGMGFGRHGMMLGRAIQADANKDGVITLDEVLAGAAKRFDARDRNKDGVLDKADAEAMQKEMAAYAVQRFMHLYGAKDGKVTRDQFNAVAKERFAERDLNRDGRIDRDDLGLGRGPRGKGGEMGPGQSPGQGPGMGPGMRDRGPPR